MQVLPLLIPDVVGREYGRKDSLHIGWCGGFFTSAPVDPLRGRIGG